MYYKVVHNAMDDKLKLGGSSSTRAVLPANEVKGDSEGRAEDTTVKAPLEDIQTPPQRSIAARLSMTLLSPFSLSPATGVVPPILNLTGTSVETIPPSTINHIQESIKITQNTPLTPMIYETIFAICRESRH
jgi:hypothetical protein